ncbi:hypothetical protein SKAU_G00097590 [Synaphobranchus kaupii]|uniref:Uncharacterized protein n=1 Tax=Synaphobranchus kaupii TaxID=118154 RepID=A0A9Q1FXY2_SYNKA|nr:hypothetical protein SKAU_G00097590 [Synaphobranchus kaupii]
MELLKADTMDVNLVSVAVDASNHKAVKLIPIVIWYFKPTEGVNFKILDFTSIPEELKEFCTFVDLEHATLLGMSKTHWLSLGPAVERVLKLYRALQSYFSSQEKAPTAIVKFLKDPVCEAWMWFMHNQLDGLQ